MSILPLFSTNIILFYIHFRNTKRHFAPFSLSRRWKVSEFSLPQKQLLIAKNMLFNTFIAFNHQLFFKTGDA
ncbi:hypothetical protein EJ73_02161 [Hoylesella shahii DSM 15611 = JCM 12083]|uniref:Uncharacterized protein n=1 Tax=Hoylesella shahii DSM 15611 = JCM 12083 TaxID=1122991 RepID=A0A318HQS6_9BACT|nr:hypothetical protein EJ73_02161 [Hoylesella shahii DSM 15611 = JCM 12083]